jgi:hypothetical protein
MKLLSAEVFVVLINVFKARSFASPGMREETRRTE